MAQIWLMSRILQEAVQRLAESVVQDYASWNGVKWHLKRRLHHTKCGIWEAVIKSMKYHFRRVMGMQKYSYTTCRCRRVFEFTPDARYRMIRMI